MKKTLLFVTTSLGYGGAAKILCFVAASLSECDYEVHIANIMTTDKVSHRNCPKPSKFIQHHRIRVKV